MTLLRVTPGNMVPEISGVDTTFPYNTILHIGHNVHLNILIKRLCDYFFLITLTMKTLEAKSSSTFLPVAASKNKTSEKPFAFASANVIQTFNNENLLHS